MDIVKIKEYSEKYKKHQIKLSKAVMIFFFIMGLVFIAAGLFFCIYDFDKNRLVLGIIIIITGIVNIPLGIKFNKLSVKGIINLSDEEAAKRYCKIYGIR